MRYWILLNRKAVGPYAGEELAAVECFGPNAILCPEGKSPEKRRNWKLARFYPELRETLKSCAAVTELAFKAGAGDLCKKPRVRRLGRWAGVPARRGGGWIFFGLLGLLTYMVFFPREPAVKPRPGLAVGLAREEAQRGAGAIRAETSVPQSVLGFYIPRRRTTIGQALGNPVHRVWPIEKMRYRIWLTPNQESPSESSAYVFEFDIGTKTLFPVNQRARSLVGGR